MVITELVKKIQSGRESDIDVSSVRELVESEDKSLIWCRRVFHKILSNIDPLLKYPSNDFMCGAIRAVVDNGLSGDVRFDRRPICILQISSYLYDISIFCSPLFDKWKTT